MSPDPVYTIMFLVAVGVIIKIIYDLWHDEDHPSDDSDDPPYRTAGTLDAVDERE